MISVLAANEHVWLRVTRPQYTDPFDTSYAKAHGGRWNPPDSWATLYLNETLSTVHAQVVHTFAGRGVEPDDLDDGAPMLLAAATLPRRQRVLDAVIAEGLASVGLPSSYPLDADHAIVDHDVTRRVGVSVHAAGLRGVQCRSAAMVGNELAWFPAATAVARPYWRDPKPYGSWRHARTLDDVA